jgi:oxygen-independent coproporphyrinogen-3 oxidase
VSGTDPLGVYVHIPFCTKRCDYCAFATWTDRWHLVDAYVAACVTDLRRGLECFYTETRPVTSVFFGGGTPSLLAADQVASILDQIPIVPGAEVTIECNPDTVDATKLSRYVDAGVNRLSLGVQSMVPHVLASLGRQHDPESVARAVEAAATVGLERAYSVDLIFGGVGETTADWERTLLAVLSLDPAPRHVSAYALTVEPGTPLWRDVGRHPDPDDQAEKYALADEALAARGLDWYEISNWAAPGRDCAHNQLYWSQGEYLGVGCAAHSHREADAGWSRRWWNVRTPERYVALVEGNSSPEAAGEDLDPAARRFEALELSLRTRSGVPTSALPTWPGDPDLDGLVEPSTDGERLVLTRRGRLLANEVAVRLRS